MPVKQKIILVEDEPHIQQLVQYNLEAAGYEVSVFSSGEEMLDACDSMIPDMFILDIMLPGIDGTEILRRIRQSAKLKNLPVIMLTAKSEEFDRVLGLELGADDYITKPFSTREFTARVKALFRRTNIPGEPISETIAIGDITMDFERHEVYKGKDKLELTLKEYELLKILMQNHGKVLSRDTLLEKVWGFDYFGETRTVDVHIRYLRQKIEEDDSKPEYIETVRGVGYRFI
ncbi:MAG TPA: DNA-binding response regulator [Ruminiclostridium sp.]|nr:DNA-binding response regulator [Ruminiclostridium sp.]